MEKISETNQSNDSIELPISQKAFLHLQNARKFGVIEADLLAHNYYCIIFTLNFILFLDGHRRITCKNSVFI